MSRAVIIALSISFSGIIFIALLAFVVLFSVYSKKMDSAFKEQTFDNDKHDKLKKERLENERVNETNETSEVNTENGSTQSSGAAENDVPKLKSFK